MNLERLVPKTLFSIHLRAETPRSLRRATLVGALVGAWLDVGAGLEVGLADGAILVVGAALVVGALLTLGAADGAILLVGAALVDGAALTVGDGEGGGVSTLEPAACMLMLLFN